MNGTEFVFINFLTIKSLIIRRFLKILSYGRHIVFVIENRIPLRANVSGAAKKFDSSVDYRLRLKGQMKLIPSWQMIVFLCHPVYILIGDLVLLIKLNFNLD